jgi:hypothetical protein
MRMTEKKQQLLQDGGAPQYVYHDRTVWRCAVLWVKDMAANDIHKEMLPMCVEHCLSRQAIHNRTKSGRGGGDAFLTMARLKGQFARGSDSNHKNFTSQVSKYL